MSLRIKKFGRPWRTLTEETVLEAKSSTFIQADAGLQSQIAAEQVERNRKGIASTANMHGRSHGAIFDTSPGTNGSV